MALTIEEVEHVASLARLSLTAQEKEMYAEQLSSILHLLEMLDLLPTDGVEPLAHVLPLFNVIRADEAGPSLPRDEAMANAALTEDGQFKVPKII